MQMITRFFSLCGIALMLSASAHAEDRPIVLELYTSQGCSSCPPADALLAQLAKNPHLLALSFHVHYWDYLGWKDPFSSEENTNRQRDYTALLGGALYTPELVVDGSSGVTGSDMQMVENAVVDAQRHLITVPVTLTPDTAKQLLNIHIAASANPDLPGHATVWAMQYKRHETTSVARGENGGRTLDNINNVTHIARLGRWQKIEQDYQLPLTDMTGNGIAVIMQSDIQGQVIGAASYQP